MIVSTKGRYALRVLIDLAEHDNGNYIPMKDVAERQEISLKYLERIMPVLARNRLVEGVHGKGGGYKLTRSPDQYVVGDILRLTEDTLAPVACLKDEPNLCKRADDCRTLPLWEGLYDVINNYLDSYTIADLMYKEDAGNYYVI